MQNNHYKIGTPIYNQRYRQSLEANEDRDNLLKRKKSVRFSVYKKMVTTYFNDQDYIHFNLEAYNFYCITRIENTEKFLPILQELTDAVSQHNHLINEFVTIAQLQEWAQQS